MNYKTNCEDGLWIVEDDLGSVIEVCETPSQAKKLIRELTAPPAQVTHYLGTYGYGDIDSSQKVEVVKKFVEEPSTATIAVVNVEPLPNVTRKSEQVRYRISIAKQNGEPRSVVVDWAVEKLAMKKPLASTYVSGNWDKV